MSSGLTLQKLNTKSHNTLPQVNLDTQTNIKNIPWRDLRHLSSTERLLDLTLWVPWFTVSLILAAWGWHLPALAASFVFFLTGLRLVHDVYHHNLGIGHRADDLVMALMSVLMLGSMHAVQHNHLRHHRHCMSDKDVEATSAHMPAWKAIAMGPIFPWLLHREAWRSGSAKTRRWMLAELSLNVAWITVAFALLDLPFLRYHILAMAAGQCLTAFFAVWTVHHDCDQEHFIARTLRGRWKTLLTFNMFYHTEHHLFPALPTRRLPRLAERLDKVAPELRQKQVF